MSDASANPMRDAIQEAITENPEAKRALFAELDRLCGPETILASNTSVIPITKIMEGLRDRSRALGTHWWNPPYLVPLVEVIGTQWTSPAAIDWTVALHKAAGKMPVHVKKDVPGFVGNRLQHALWREAISLVENGICDAETVDTVIKAAFGRRLLEGEAMPSSAAIAEASAVPTAPASPGEVAATPEPSPTVTMRSARR